MDQNSDILDEGITNPIQNDGQTFSTHQMQYTNNVQVSQNSNLNNRDQSYNQFSQNLSLNISHNYPQNSRLDTNYQKDHDKFQNLCKQQQNNQFDSIQTQVYAIEQKQIPLQIYGAGMVSIQKSLTKIFYRNFHNRLISFYIQCLKEEQRNIRMTKQIQIKVLKQQNWPFKDLFYKKNRNANDQIMLEFVSMCACKIQATFKSYLTQKRHNIALSKLQSFRKKLSALVSGWKTRNIYNCRNIVELRKTARSITQQIDRQLSNPNTDRLKKMRKIQYLNQNQSLIKQTFNQTFDRFYQSGTWIYEVDSCFRKPLSKIKMHSDIHQMHSNKHQNQPYDQDTPIRKKQQITAKKSRKRQFQAPKPQKKQKQTAIFKKNKEPLINGAPQFNNQASYQGSHYEQRPIVAKGQYMIDEQNLKNSQNEFLKQKQLGLVQNKQQGDGQSSDKKINKLQADQRKKLIKRQKYDPRKAIEDQKKRLEEEKHKIKQPAEISQKQIKKTEKTPPKINKKTPLKRKRQERKEHAESPRESSKQKTVQKIKKESKLTRKDDNSKSIKLITNNKKVASKVDCWGPKKQLSTPNLIIQESSYKSKYLMNMKQRNELKNTCKDPSHIKQSEYIGKKINNQQQNQAYQAQGGSIQRKLKHLISQNEHLQNKSRHQDIQQAEDETYKSSYLKNLVQSREKGSFSYQNGKPVSQKRIVEKIVTRTQQIPHRQSTSRKEQLSRRIDMIRKEQMIEERFQQHSNMQKMAQNHPIENNRMGQNLSSVSNLKNLNRQIKVSQQHNSSGQAIKRKQEVYRSVQSLQDVYLSQYTDRLNNLKNKLNMLQSTRYIQRDESIAVLLEDSKFVRKIYKDHAFSSLYWPQVKTMETNFLDYIRFNFAGI